GGGTFRIAPVRPPEELRAQALAATPPDEAGDFLDSDLVELVTLDPTIRLDIRYASTNNFMGEVFYPEPRAFLQRPAAEALVRAHRWLGERGYGLLVHDGYRPWYVTKMFWDATPEGMKVFVADPASGSRHNRGAAVDLTLYDRATGEPVEMPGGYDEFSPRSFPDYPGGTSRQRWHRELLREAMEREGFTVYEAEWWHFDYVEWRRYRIGNRTFEELRGR
ncbi:MAG TPA: M15 family metallopeptidase, partial [Longimicrobiales bacterium]|nr:M15 family metallopeptidase [Longimicrobiales bacterium]